MFNILVFLHIHENCQLFNAGIMAVELSKSIFIHLFILADNDNH